MIKSLVNKIRLKERLYALKIPEGTLLKSHLDEFNSILVDLENLEVNIDEEDKAILLVCSLACSYCNFKDIILYGSGETLSLEDAKTSLLAKEKYDSENVFDEQAKGLMVRDRTSEKGHGNRSKFGSRSKGKNNK